MIRTLLVIVILLTSGCTHFHTGAWYCLGVCGGVDVEKSTNLNGLKVLQELQKR